MATTPTPTSKPPTTSPSPPSASKPNPLHGATPETEPTHEQVTVPGAPPRSHEQPKRQAPLVSEYTKSEMTAGKEALASRSVRADAEHEAGKKAGTRTTADSKSQE